MRRIAFTLLALALTACEPTAPAPAPVDPQNLGPLSSKEQALIFGADGAARQGNIAAAERDYLNAVGASTGHIEAHLALAQLYEKQHETGKERDILDRALVFQPNHPLVNYLLGKLDLDEFKYNDAIQHFDRGLKTKPDDVDLNTGKAVANDMLGNHSAAQMIYTRALRVNSGGNIAGLRTNLAMSYLLNEQPKKAVEILQTDVKKPGASSVTRHDLALAYGTLGRNTEARKLLNGDIDEETRLLAVARLREYWKARTSNPYASPPIPLINGDKKINLEGQTFQKKLSRPVGLPANSPLAKAIRADEAAKKAARADATLPE